MKELETGAWSHRKGYQIERSSHQRLLHVHLPVLQEKESKTHMEQRDNTIESLLTQVEELRSSQKEEMIGIKGRINNLEILSRKQCTRQLKVCAGEVRKWSVKIQGTKRQDAMQFFNRAVAAEVMVSIFTMTISFVFLTVF
jgi:hypothetical protein